MNNNHRNAVRNSTNKDVVRSDEYKMCKGGLPVLLGYDEKGHAVIEDIGEINHLWISGTNTKENTQYVGALLNDLIQRYSSDQIGIILVDTDFRFKPFHDVPHVIETAYLYNRVADILVLLLMIIHKRHLLLGEEKADSIEDYNRKVRELIQSDEDTKKKLMKRLVLIISSCVNFMTKENASLMREIAKTSKEVGVHMIFETQPSRAIANEIKGVLSENRLELTDNSRESLCNAHSQGDVGTDSLCIPCDATYIRQHTNEIKLIRSIRGGMPNAVPLTKEGFLDTDAVVQRILEQCSGSVIERQPDGSEAEIFTLRVDPEPKKLSVYGTSEVPHVYKNCAETTAELLVDHGIADRKKAFDTLIRNAKALGLMPDDEKVIRETLAGFGFVIQSTAVEGIRPEKALEKLGDLGGPAIVVFQSRDYPSHHGGNMFSFHTDHFSYDMNDYLPIPYCGFSVIHVFIRWDDGVDRSPFPRRKGRRKANNVLTRRQYPETPYYKPYQPNPAGNYIGDCVVRAFSGALDIEWDKAVELLAAKEKAVINSRNVYQEVFKENGFVYHKAIKRDGHSIDGKAFCEEMNKTFHNGERIIAYVQRNHMAAVVPVESPVESDGNRKTYKFIDCWDSSKRRIGEYWVLPRKTSGAAE